MQGTVRSFYEWCQPEAGVAWGRSALPTVIELSSRPAARHVFAGLGEGEKEISDINFDLARKTPFFLFLFVLFIAMCVYATR